MNINASLKNIVRHKYSQIAEQASGCGCSSGCCGQDVSYSVLSDDYSQVEGYIRHADLGLGCGLPTEHAGIEEGDIVVDLGAGAGNDAFIARHLVGARGQVVGVDMTPAMVTKAILNTVKLGFENVEFRLGDIEELPVENDYADVVISNCVLNLVPDKKKSFAEIHRILK
ncbi:methyltransferase domain-containing protein, partial [candidate division KSB1 bacterium]|nr:methyltransferase domain-containing protein [candidate division KSB1 bacterium]